MTQTIRNLLATVTVAGGALLSLASAPAGAQNWVSAATGADANNCSRATPCRTFAGAIAKTAAGGSISCIDSGDYGTVVVTVGISIDCRHVLARIRTAEAVGIDINTQQGDVSIRGVSIEGRPNSGCTPCSGIRVQRANKVELMDVSIRQTTGSGIEVGGFGGRLILTRVSSALNQQHGMLLSPTQPYTYATVMHSDFLGNALTGMRVNEMAFAYAADSTFSTNGTHGVTAFTTNGLAAVFLERVSLVSNASSGAFSNGPAAQIHLSDVSTMFSWALYPAANGGLYYSFGNNKAGPGYGGTDTVQPAAKF